MVYFDYCANYPIKKEVLEELNKVELTYFGNANSMHFLGKQSFLKLQKYDSKIKNILRLRDKDIIYTSSATEANNLAIKGICKSYSGFGRHILVSEFEHNSTNATLSFLKENGFDIEFVKTLSNGQIDLDDLKAKITNSTIMFICILVEGETGAIQNYETIIGVLSEYKNCHLLMDATQAVGKIEFDFNKIELITFTPHKFGGLTGTGCLIKNKSTILTPLIHGGKSNSVYRSGSIPLGLIAATYKSLEIAITNMRNNYEYVKSLNDYFKSKVKNLNNIVINSFENPYIINISIKDVKGHEAVKYLDDKGICVSQKSACSITNTPSKAIMSIYKDKKRALSSFRISLSEMTTFEEIDILIKELEVLNHGKI